MATTLSVFAVEIKDYEDYRKALKYLNTEDVKIAYLDEGTGKE